MQQNKKEFVQEFGELLRKYCPEYDIDNLRYCNPGEIFDEEVVVTFTNGYEHPICVNYDSIPAMIRDIMRGIVL